MNSVKWPCFSMTFVAQWIECPPPPGVLEVMGSIPVFRCSMLVPS